MLATMAGLLFFTPSASAQVVVPRVTLDDPAIGDQDDMCVWVHPGNPASSTIITSDKDSNLLFVYDLAGNTVQALPAPGQPGNIDVRYGFVLAGNPTDIVVVNDRDNDALLVYGVNPATRQLARIDNGAIDTQSNYGACLYHDAVAGEFYAFTTSSSGVIRQFRLVDQAGRVGATQVRSWSFSGQTEACACDDPAAIGYFAEEDVGVWKVGARPGDPGGGALIAAAGDASGLTADVEGLAIYHAANGHGYLLVSSQGSSTFKVYDRLPPHTFVKSFTLSGVTGTDGIDVANVALGPSFPSGIFTAHNDTPADKSVEVCAYEDLGLAIDTGSWNPRGPHTDVPDRAPAAMGVTTFPNPFGPTTRIRYTSARPGRVRVAITDLAGRVVVRLTRGHENAGEHEIVWEGRDAEGRQVRAGVYLVSVEVNGARSQHRVVRVR